MAVNWRIYYDDGSTFSNEDGSLQDAPAFGVQAVVCDPDLWGTGDFVGLIDYLIKIGIVKFGRLARNEDYHQALTTARQDPDMGPDRHVYEQGDYYWYNGSFDFEDPHGR